MPAVPFQLKILRLAGVCTAMLGELPAASTPIALQLPPVSTQEASQLALAAKLSELSALATIFLATSCPVQFSER